MGALLDKTLDLLVQQYKHAVKINKLYRALLAESDPLEQLWLHLKLRVFIDHAAGVQLDVIGRIISLERPIVEQDPAIVYSFDGPTDGRGFSGVDRSDVGGVFNGLDPVAIGFLDDFRYRNLLRAKIMRNVTRCTIDDMAEFARFVFGAGVTIINGLGFIDVNIERQLTIYEQQQIASLFPVPAGVRLRIKSYSVLDNPFGFAGNAESSGFGSVALPQTGGGFSGLFN